MYKILVVDDDPSLRFLITASLEDEEYDISEAADGIEAYKMIQKEKPDLILLDVMMPGMTGYELCTALKQNSDTKNILVIMLTAKGQERDKRDSKQAGADLYLRKPFSPLELIDIVSSLLKGNGTSEKGNK